MINGIGSSTSSLLGQVGSGVVGGITRLAGGRETATASLSTSARIAAEGAPIDTDRVAALRTAIRAGSYRADPTAIAGRMIEADL